MADPEVTSYTDSSIHTNLTKDLPIIEGATVSRVVVNNEVLRYVIFSFDAGQILTEHTSTRAVIVQILGGAIDFSIRGEVSHLHEGDIVYLAPNDRHALTAIEPSHMALTLVDVDAIKKS